MAEIITKEDAAKKKKALAGLGGASVKKAAEKREAKAVNEAIAAAAILQKETAAAGIRAGELAAAETAEMNMLTGSGDNAALVEKLKRCKEFEQIAINNSPDAVLKILGVNIDDEESLIAARGIEIKPRQIDPKFIKGTYSGGTLTNPVLVEKAEDRIETLRALRIAKELMDKKIHWVLATEILNELAFWQLANLFIGTISYEDPATDKATKSPSLSYEVNPFTHQLNNTKLSLWLPTLNKETTVKRGSKNVKITPKAKVKAITQEIEKRKKFFDLIRKVLANNGKPLPFKDNFQSFADSMPTTSNGEREVRAFLYTLPEVFVKDDVQDSPDAANTEYIDRYGVKVKGVKKKEAARQQFENSLYGNNILMINENLESNMPLVIKPFEMSGAVPLPQPSIQKGLEINYGDDKTKVVDIIGLSPQQVSTIRNEITSLKGKINARMPIGAAVATDYLTNVGATRNDSVRQLPAAKFKTSKSTRGIVRVPVQSDGDDDDEMARLLNMKKFSFGKPKRRRSYGRTKKRRSIKRRSIKRSGRRKSQVKHKRRSVRRNAKRSIRKYGNNFFSV